MKPPLRTKSLGTKVSDAEYARLEALASARRQTISEFIRSVLLQQIAAPNGHGSTEQVLLAEVVGLRTILLNLFFKLANGERITAEEMRGGWPGSRGFRDLGWYGASLRESYPLLELQLARVPLIQANHPGRKARDPGHPPIKPKPLLFFSSDHS